MITDQDIKYINRCFELAKLGAGKVSPNPLVGAVIVNEGKIISEGWHEAYGKDHAEAMAIKKAKQNLSGATLYCNLEPCIHLNKKTPPCFPLVVNAGIKRVVLSNSDPNPLVAGKSIEQMKKTGIQVETGVLREEGLELNRFFFKHIVKNMPWITLKIAQSIDAKISVNSRQQTWLTGPESKKYVHQLRSEYDALLVGTNTINVDDPQLNVREVSGRNPLKIILAPKLQLNTDAKIFRNATGEKVWIFCDEQIIDSAGEKFGKDVKLIASPLSSSGRIELNFIMDYLYGQKIGSVLVEGGQMIFSNFIETDCYDELIVLQAPLVMGDGLEAVRLAKMKKFKLHAATQLGNDLCLNLRKKEIN